MEQEAECERGRERRKSRARAKGKEGKNVGGGGTEVIVYHKKQRTGTEVQRSLAFVPPFSSRLPFTLLAKDSCC